MTSIVVGGHARKVGKTAVAAGIIAAFSRFPWTAIKITSHQHADAPLSEAFTIQEETDRTGQSDTSRFLVAGAARALWVRAREKNGDAALRQLLPALHSNPFVIFESNRILQFFRPDVYIMVLHYDVEDFKQSARETLRQADAIVAINYRPSPPQWNHCALPAGVPLFTTPSSHSIPEDLVAFVRLRLPLLRESI